MVALDAWLASERGQYFVAQEQAWLNATVPSMFGLLAVQLGTRQLDGLSASCMPHRVYVQAEPGLGPSPSCLAHFHALPFEAQSVDLMVLPHVLECVPNPQCLLREVERVLLPEGKVLITGFNPYSMWGLVHGVAKPWWPVWPQGCAPLALGQLKAWLRFLSLEPMCGRFGAYRPPLRQPLHQPIWGQGLGFLEHAGDRWWPNLGGLYCLGVVKRVQGMRLLGPTWWQRPAKMRRFKAAGQCAAKHVEDADS
jgi:SAM-dependent methyltransferase